MKVTVAALQDEVGHLTFPSTVVVIHDTSYLVNTSLPWLQRQQRGLTFPHTGKNTCPWHHGHQHSYAKITKTTNYVSKYTIICIYKMEMHLSIHYTSQFILPSQDSSEGI